MTAFRPGTVDLRVDSPEVESGDLLGMGTVFFSISLSSPSVEPQVFRATRSRGSGQIERTLAVVI